MTAIEAVADALRLCKQAGIVELATATGYGDRSVGEALRALRRREEVEIVGRVKGPRGGQPILIYRWKAKEVA